MTTNLTTSMIWKSLKTKNRTKARTPKWTTPRWSNSSTRSCWTPSKKALQTCISNPMKKCIGYAFVLTACYRRWPGPRSAYPVKSPPASRSCPGSMCPNAGYPRTVVSNSNYLKIKPLISVSAPARRCSVKKPVYVFSIPMPPHCRLTSSAMKIIKRKHF